MHLESFAVQKFRNLRVLEMTLIPGMNVVYGENAQGKTNLLEGIYMLSTLRSFRTRQINEAVAFGENSALLHGSLQRGQSRHSLTVSIEGATKTSVLDKKKVDALHYLGTFDVFLFSYPLLEVVRGGPEERRKFLDRAIAISRPAYLASLMHYHRALRQKNVVLGLLQKREMGRKEGTDEVLSFNQQMAEHGIPIAHERSVYLAALQERLNARKHLFFPEDCELGIEWKSNFTGDIAEINSALDKNIDREIARGTALIGIHRDEITLTFDGKELRKYGSSGQHRAYLLLMLLSQLQLYESMKQDRPVLLLDDLDSELDQGKIHSFLSEISGRYQTLVSTSRRELFARGSDVRLFEIQAGELLEM